jgi:hypothetical protein
MKVARSPSGIFEFRPILSGDHLAVAMCDLSNESYCQFTFQFPEQGCYLLEYGGRDGVREVGYAGQPSELLRGITRQLVMQREDANAYKTWTGQIVRTHLFREPNVLTFVINKESDEVREISAQLDGIEVPFSAFRYYGDAEDLFAALGVVVPEEGISADVASFTRDGRVIVNASFFDPEVIHQGVEIVRVLDVAAELVSEQTYSEIEVAAATPTNTHLQTVSRTEEMTAAEVQPTSSEGEIAAATATNGPLKSVSRSEETSADDESRDTGIQDSFGPTQSTTEEDASKGDESDSGKAGGGGQTGLIIGVTVAAVCVIAGVVGFLLWKKQTFVHFSDEEEAEEAKEPQA